MKRTIRIGTRSSRLAMAQTQIVSELIGRTSPATSLKIVPVRTKGDRLPPDRRQSDEKSAFTGDLEEKLSAGEVDVAVHSLKDLPNELLRGLVVAAFPKRGDPRDALVSRSRLSELPKGAKLGTSSLRRRVQLLRMRPDLDVVTIHGNVETRIEKIAKSGLDGVVLAAAGLERIGVTQAVSQRFNVAQMVPAVGQGTIAVEARKDDDEVTKLLAGINHGPTKQAADCERRFSLRLGGDCNVPVGAFAVRDGRELKARGFISSVDGKSSVRKAVVGDASEAGALGDRLAGELLEMGGREIMEAGV